ncbi:hypothetical protein [Pseudoramibacter alactolyticus]
MADAIKISGRKKPNASPINTDDFWGAQRKERRRKNSRDFEKKSAKKMITCYNEIKLKSPRRIFTR